MKKSLCLLLSLLVLCAFGARTHAEDNIIYIGSFSELKAFSDAVAKGDSMAGRTVCLTADIELDASFAPIGKDKDNPFSGRFNGGGYSLSDLTLSGGDYLGLFGCIDGGTVENLNLKNVNISGENYVGAVVGRLYAYSGASKASVKNCSVEGSVSGKSYVGGAVGYCAANASSGVASANVENISFYGTAVGEMYVGGAVGKAEAYGNGGAVGVSDCVTLGTVEALGTLGSLAGGVLGGALSRDKARLAVDNCVFDGTVKARIKAAGGILGSFGAENGDMTVKGCAVYGTVNSIGGCGGIAYEGYAEVEGCIVGCSLIGDDIYTVAKGASVSNCYAYITAFPAEGTALTAELPTPPLGFAFRQYKAGDADGNGDINAADAALVLRADVRLCALGVQAAIAADTTADGKVNAADAARILRYDVGLISKL